MNACKKTYDSLDLLKFVLSFIVVAIHFDPFGVERLRGPVLMLPVPLFFIISSFLFFRKTPITTKRLMKFASRNLILYTAYFLLFLPYYARIWWNAYFSKSILYGFKTMLIKFIFGSTFRSSWYIVALVIGVILVYFLSKTKIKWLPLTVGAVFYIICMLMTCYGNLMVSNTLFNKIVGFYPETFYQSFPVAVFWVALGKIIAEYEEKIIQIPLKNKLYMTAVSVALLVVEYFIISIANLEYSMVYCVMLVPLCVMIFIVVLGLEIRVPNAKFLRETSTVMYCLHTTLGVILEKVFLKVGVNIRIFPWTFILYVTIVMICISGTVIITKLQNYRIFNWLKYFK